MVIYEDFACQLVPHLKVQEGDAIKAIQNLFVIYNSFTVFTVYPTYRTVKAENPGACTVHIFALIIVSDSPESFMYPTLAVVQKKVEEFELFRVACIPAPFFQQKNQHNKYQVSWMHIININNSQ